MEEVGGGRDDVRDRISLDPGPIKTAGEVLVETVVGQEVDADG